MALSARKIPGPSRLAPLEEFDLSNLTGKEIELLERFCGVVGDNAMIALDEMRPDRLKGLGQRCLQAAKLLPVCR